MSINLSFRHGICNTKCRLWFHILSPADTGHCYYWVLTVNHDVDDGGGGRHPVKTCWQTCRTFSRMEARTTLWNWRKQVSRSPAVGLSSFKSKLWKYVQDSFSHKLHFSVNQWYKFSLSIVSHNLWPYPHFHWISYLSNHNDCELNICIAFVDGR